MGVSTMEENKSFWETVRTDFMNGIATVNTEMRAGFSNIEGRLDGVDKRLDGVDKRLDGVDKRLDGVDKRLDGVDKRLDGVDKRLDGVDKHLGELDNRINHTNIRLRRFQLEVQNQFRLLKNKVIDMDLDLGQRMSQLEERMDNLEDNGNRNGR